MRLGIDLVNLRSFHEGTGRYARQLLDGLASADGISQCVLFVNEMVAGQFDVDDPRFRKVVVEAPRRKYLPSNQLYFALGKKLRGLDFLHSPVSVSPLFSRTRTIITVHDLAFAIYPEYYSKTGLLYWRFALRWACRKASRVLADSESTKQDLMRFMGVPAQKIRVVYPCLSLSCDGHSPGSLAGFRLRYGLPENYVLHIGAPQGRKNLATLVKSFRIAKEKAAIPHKLVLAGPESRLIDTLSAVIADSGMQDEVIFPGFIPEDDLPLLYQSAALLAFPSLYEGFGYPPLEAMGCGTPVVTSDASSLPEVAGGAGLFVADPLNPEELATKILQVLQSPEMAAKMRALGLARARQFSRERMVAGILKAYEEVRSL